jgi:predicted nucleic acid-binding protein
MEASLDTNIIIHLYNANLQELLFNRFTRLVAYEFIRNHELKNHADNKILSMFDQDVVSGKIHIVTDKELRAKKILKIFESHVYNQRILYDSTDLGEVYAISLAKTLGCISLVTDDIKIRGPHYTLMRTPDSDVMPFAFHELLLLDYLEGVLDINGFVNCFQKINEVSGLNWNTTSKLKNFMKRFWIEPFSNKEEEWMRRFCDDRKIEAKTKLFELKEYITKNLTNE